MNDQIAPHHPVSAHTCRCGCARCKSQSVGQEIDRLARESLSAALMHAQDGLEYEADEATPWRPAAIARRLGSARPRPPARTSRFGRRAGFDFIPPMRHEPMRLTRAVLLSEVLAGKHPDYDAVAKGVGRIYLLRVPDIDRPLYVGEVRPDSEKQTLTNRMRQHTRKGKKETCGSDRNFRESCVLREALLGRFEQLRKVLARAGLGKRERDLVERHITAGKVMVQYASFRLPRGADPNDLNARTQLQHSAELFAKNQLRALIRSNSLSFEEEQEQEQQEPRRPGTAEYRVV